MADFEGRYGRSPKANTRRNQVTALRAFYEYLDHRDLLLDADGTTVRNPMDKVAIPKAEATPNDFLSGAEDMALLSGAWTLPDRVVVSLLRHTGIRVGEAHGLKIKDVHLSGNNRILVTKSKTAAGLRTVPLSPELVPILYAWFDHLTRRGLWQPKAPLLCTSNGTPINCWQILKLAGSRGSASCDRLVRALMANHWSTFVRNDHPGNPRGDLDRRVSRSIYSFVSSSAFAASNSACDRTPFSQSDASRSSCSTVHRCFPRSHCGMLLTAQPTVPDPSVMLPRAHRTRSQAHRGKRRRIMRVLP